MNKNISFSIIQLFFWSCLNKKTLASLKEKIEQLQKEGFTRFVLDMAKLSKVDSAVLETFVELAASLESQDGGLAFNNIPSELAGILDMLSMNEMFSLKNFSEKFLGK